MSDARVLWATLTDRGLGQLRDAMPVHLRGVEEHFLTAIPEGDRDALLHALEAIVARLRGSSAVAACENAARFEASARPIASAPGATPAVGATAVAGASAMAAAAPVLAVAALARAGE